MRRLLPIVGFLLLTLPCWATWSNVQRVSKTTCATSATSCAVTVTSTGTGHVLTAQVILPTSATISSVSGGGTWTHPASCNDGNSTTSFVDSAYALTSTSGTTSITVNVSVAQSGGNWIAIIEEESSTGTPAFDVCGHILDTTTCTSCVGPNPAQTGSNDFGVAVAGCGATCTGVTGSGWTNRLTNPGGDGVIDAENMTSFVRPSFTQNALNALASTMLLFNDGGAAAAVCQSRALMGVGC